MADQYDPNDPGILSKIKQGALQMFGQEKSPTMGNVHQFDDSLQPQQEDPNMPDYGSDEKTQMAKSMRANKRSLMDKGADIDTASNFTYQGNWPTPEHVDALHTAMTAGMTGGIASKTAPLVEEVAPNVLRYKQLLGRLPQAEPAAQNFGNVIQKTTTNQDVAQAIKQLQEQDAIGNADKIKKLSQYLYGKVQVK